MEPGRSTIARTCSGRTQRRGSVTESGGANSILIPLISCGWRYSRDLYHSPRSRAYKSKIRVDPSRIPKKHPIFTLLTNLLVERLISRTPDLLDSGSLMPPKRSNTLTEAELRLMKV